MYRIGLATAPIGDEVIWTLDINYYIPENDDKYPLLNHSAQIQIHSDSLSACMLKAQVICEALNTDGIAMVEILVQLLDHARVMEDELQDKVDAEDNS